MFSVLSQLQAIVNTQEDIKDYIDKEVTIAELQRILWNVTSAVVYTTFRQAGLSISDLNTSPRKRGVLTKILLTKDIVNQVLQVSKKSENKKSSKNKETQKSEIEAMGISFSEMRKYFQDVTDTSFHLRHFEEAWSHVSTVHPELFFFHNTKNSGKVMIVKVRDWNKEEVGNLLAVEYLRRCKQESEKIQDIEK